VKSQHISLHSHQAPKHRPVPSTGQKTCLGLKQMSQQDKTQLISTTAAIQKNKKLRCCFLPFSCIIHGEKEGQNAIVSKDGHSTKDDVLAHH